MTSEWKPIETAPKDGTFIIGVREFWRPCVMHYETYEGVFRWGPDPETFMEEDHFLEYWLNTEYAPTHWMPLPPPPGDE